MTDSPHPITYRDREFAGRAARDAIGEKAFLYLDPESRSVGTYNVVGSGVPERAYHRRALLVAIPSDASLESALEIVKSNEDVLVQLFDAYKGIKWNGHNHVGRWASDGGDCDSELDLLDQIETAMEGATRCWNAYDWLRPSWSEARAECKETILKGGDRDEAISLEVKRNLTIALQEGDAILDEDELRGVIEELFAEADREIAVEKINNAPLAFLVLAKGVSSIAAVNKASHDPSLLHHPYAGELIDIGRERGLDTLAGPGKLVDGAFLALVEGVDLDDLENDDAIVAYSELAP